MNFLRYAAVVFVLTFGLPIVLGLIKRVLGVNLTTAFILIVPAMIAAGIEGPKHAAKYKRKPTGSETVTFTLIGTLLAVGAQGIFLVMLVAFEPEFNGWLYSAGGGGLAIGAFLFITVAIAFSNLVSFRMGATDQLKRNNPSDVFK